MPYVNIKITPDGATAERKAQVIAGVTRVLVEILGKDPATTMVVIEEVALEGWGLNGRAAAAPEVAQ